jgi:chemotaxis signal transduction protein
VSDPQASAGGRPDLATLQQALRAFGSGSAPPTPAEAAVLAQRLGLQSGVPGLGMTEASGPQFVLVRMGELEMGWPAANVVGVERVSEITPVPFTAEWLLGIANLRGAITSVVDLRYFLGMPRASVTAQSRIVVASANGMVIGFLVDGINEIRVVPPEAQAREIVRQAAPPWLAPFVESVAQIAEGRRVLIIDLQRLLFADALHQYRMD